MAITRELSIGEHTVKYSKPPDYADLVATIDVGEGAVSCVSVTGGYCGSITPPGLVASGFTVTGYLAEAGADICSWIDESGVGLLTPDHALYVYYLSAGAMGAASAKYDGLSPQPSELGLSLATVDNALGVFYYSQGALGAGNTKTGCSYA